MWSLYEEINVSLQAVKQLNDNLLSVAIAKCLPKDSYVLDQQWGTCVSYSGLPHKLESSLWSYLQGKTDSFMFLRFKSYAANAITRSTKYFWDLSLLNWFSNCYPLTTTHIIISNKWQCEKIKEVWCILRSFMLIKW